MKDLSFVSFKIMSWYINIYSITNWFDYLLTCLTKYYRSMYCSKMTKSMDQHNVPNGVVRLSSSFIACRRV